MTKRLRVVGIGNALVDVLARVDDAFLDGNELAKGVMTLIDTRRAAALYDAMGPATEKSGGSVANTIAGLALLGAPSGFMGKVKDDQLGRIFSHDIRSLGAEYATPMAPAALDGQETGRSMVMVTPDGERTMATYLGVSAELAPGDIDERMLAETDWLYLEGYRFDGPESQDAFLRAVRATREAGGRVAVTLSDPFCVERHRDAFARLVRDEVDLLFANAAEIRALYRTETVAEALDAARAEVPVVACTVGPKGALMATADGVTEVPAAEAERVDATGAGDLFAAGVFAGLAHGKPLAEAGAMGCLAAAAVIQQIGARPDVDLSALFAQHGH